MLLLQDLQHRAVHGLVAAGLLDTSGVLRIDESLEMAHETGPERRIPQRNVLQQVVDVGQWIPVTFWYEAYGFDVVEIVGGERGVDVPLDVWQLDDRFVGRDHRKISQRDQPLEREVERHRRQYQ